MEIFKLLVFFCAFILLFVNVRDVFKFILIAVLLIIFQLLYADLGNDYKEYHEFYNTLDERFNFEVGFTWLVIIFKYIGFTFVQFYTIYNIFYFVFLLGFVSRWTNNGIYFLLPYTSFMYYSVHINAIRQSIAILIFTYSFKYIVHGSVLKYSILISVASIFHRSALFLWALIFIKRLLHAGYRFYLYWFVFFLFLLIFNINLFSPLVNFLIDSLPLLLSNKINFYSNEVSDGRFGIGLIDRLFLFVTTYYILNSFSRLNLLTDSLTVLGNLIMLYLLLQLAFFEYNFLFQRIKFYFFPFIFMLWCKYFTGPFKVSNKLIFLGFIVFYCLANTLIKTI